VVRVMSEIIGLDKLPESMSQEARKKLIMMVERLARACQAEEARIAYVVRIIGGYEVTATFINPQIDYELAFKQFYKVGNYQDQNVHIRIFARYPCVEAPERQLWLEAVIRIYVY